MRIDALFIVAGTVAGILATVLISVTQPAASSDVLSIKIVGQAEALAFAAEEMRAGHCVQLERADGSIWLHSCEER